MLDKRNERLFLWAVFAGYVLLLLMALANHELWGDEIHSWNIARSSTGLLDLLNNSRYEGHPPLWYVVLYTITRSTHEPESMKGAQALFAIGAVFVLLFHSPFPLAIRGLIPFGYYFAFEYGALSRNYAIALLLAFLLAWLLVNRPGRHKGWFYVMVLLLSCTHLLGLLLAASFCTYRAWEERAGPAGWRGAAKHLVLGGLLCLPAALQIAPPGDSQLNLRFWLDIWTDKQWDIIAQAPLKAFVPVPETNELHFWNTNTLLRRILEGAHGVGVVRACAVLLLTLWVFLLRKVGGSVVFLLTNVVLTAAVAFLFPLTSARYVGFLWVGFLLASWLHLRHRPLGLGHRLFLGGVLLIHLAAGAIAIDRDRTQPFSNAAKVRELHAKVPAGAMVVTDYWCLNNLSAFLDRPFHCLEHRKELSFLRWDQELARATKQPDFYTSGLRALWDGGAVKEVYMISVNDPDRLRDRDKALHDAFELTLLDRHEGAIEAHSNVYLYRVVQRAAGH
ncbi:MAG: hypothetical protein JNL05_11210 [Flavobacteriales bacterium]|nr:hypothetical protein [Flavobacteriales bacterium]